MLKKGDNFLQNSSTNRRQKPIQQNSQNYCQSNKQNVSKSLFEHVNDTSINHNKSKTGEQSNYGSTMVSPTFQSHNIISLKEDLFRQNKNYLQVNVNLKDLNRKVEDKTQPIVQNVSKKVQQVASKRQLEEEKQRLADHYKNKKYWSKIQKLFEQEGVDAVLAWEDSISKYKTLKQKLEQCQQFNSKLTQQIQIKSQSIHQLQRQIAQEKNQTRVLSQKKCKGCQGLQQKEKEYFELYEQSKKQQKDLRQKEEQLSACKKQISKVQQKYLQEKSLKEQMQKKRALLKEQLQKKNVKLVQRQKIEKQLGNELLKYQQTQRETSKLYIECQQLKEIKYQAQKTLAKCEEKYRKELNEQYQKYKDLQQEKNIYEEEMNKLRSQLSQLKPKVLKSQIELESGKSTLTIKNNECDELKKKHIESMTEQVRRRNELQSLLKHKQEELINAYQLIDEGENIKIKLEFQLNHQRKCSQDKDEEINKYIEIIKQLEGKNKETDSNENRGKQTKYFCNMGKLNGSHSSNSSQSNQNCNGPFSKKIVNKIRDIYSQIKQICDDTIDTLQRKKYRQQQFQSVDNYNSFQLQRHLNQIHSHLSNFINKYYYIHQQNDILKEQLETEQQYKENEQQYKQTQRQYKDQIKRIKKQVHLKEQTLKSVLAFIPDQLKNGIIELLQLTQTLISNEQPQDSQIEQYEEMKSTIQKEGKQWKQNYHRLKFKFRKMEDDLRKLQEQNEQLKKRNKGKQLKKVIATDYDYSREVVSKKDIRRKYNFDN